MQAAVHFNGNPSVSFLTRGLSKSFCVSDELNVIFGREKFHFDSPLEAEVNSCTGPILS